MENLHRKLFSGTSDSTFVLLLSRHFRNQAKTFCAVEFSWVHTIFRYHDWGREKYLDEAHRFLKSFDIEKSFESVLEMHLFTQSLSLDVVPTVDFSCRPHEMSPNNPRKRLESEIYEVIRPKDDMLAIGLGSRTLFP